MHIAPRATNRCTTSPDELIELVGRLRDQCDRVVLLGDVYDLSRPRRPLAWREHLAEIEREHPARWAALSECEAIFGNHDAQLAALGVPEERSYQGGEHDLILIHGHQNDPFLKKIWGLPESANFVAGWLERGGLSPAARALGQVPLLVDGLTRGVRRALPKPSARERAPRRERDVELAARLIADGWDIVAAGHSHALRLELVDGGLYVNTGAHCHGTVDHAVIDTGEGWAETWRDGRRVARAERAGDAWALVDP